MKSRFIARSIVVLFGVSLPLLVAPLSLARQLDSSAEKPLFRQEELEQMLAPLALYPDPLLSQVLMASTYPLEIVEADRWIKANKALSGDALTSELEKQTWDPSVKSLVNFPEVLDALSQKLDWTVKIGDAFIADQAAVLETVQSLRAKAQEAGNLPDNAQQKIVVETPPAGSTSGTTQIIRIEPADPQVIYVPAYDPVVVYGAWPYPAYPPPVYYRPPGYAATALSFGAGFVCGAAWGYAWGGCDWGHNDIDIDIDRNTNINTNINREKYKANFESRATGGKWAHEPTHRRGVEYRDNRTARQYGGTSSLQANRARDDYRGRAETGRRDVAQSTASPYRKASEVGVSTPGVSSRDRSAARGETRAPSASPSTGTRDSAFSGINQGAAGVRADSQRGHASRQTSYRPPSGGSRGAYGGGASRGGGGARGGGGRR